MRCVTHPKKKHQVLLVVLHQDAILGVLENPGDPKSGKKYFHRIFHKKIGL